MSLYLKEKLAGRTIGFRLFLEGVEVPVAGGQVIEQRNEKTQASFKLPPAPAILCIRPRTHLLCTYRINAGDWEVLFEGETAGRGFMKSAVSGQQATINAVSFASQLDIGMRSYLEQVKDPGIEISVFKGRLEAQAQEQMNDFFSTGDFNSKIFEALFKDGATGGLDGMLYQVIQLLYTGEWTSPFFLKMESKYKMTERFLAIMPGLMEHFAQRQNIGTLFRNTVLSSTTANTTVWSLINLIQQLTWVEYIENNRIGRGPKFMLKPNLFWAVPPRCNCIFPDQYGQANFNINELGEITRLHVRVQNELTNKDFDSESAIGFVSYRNTTATAPTALANCAGFKKLPFYEKHQYETYEETERGIIPKIISLSGAHDAALGAYWAKDVHHTGSSGPKAEDVTRYRNEYIHKFASAQYFLEKYSGRPIPLAMIFSPQLQTGYPGAIFTDYGYLLGDMSQTVHEFDAVGGVTTSCVLERGRFATDFVPETPEWMEKGQGFSFKPLAIEKFYREHLGCSSLIDLKTDDIDPTKVTVNKRSSLSGNIDFGAFGGTGLSTAEKAQMQSVLSESSTFDQYLPPALLKAMRETEDGSERWSTSQIIHAMMEYVYRTKYMPSDDKHRFILDYTRRITHSESSVFAEMLGAKPSTPLESIDGPTGDCYRGRDATGGQLPPRPHQIWTGANLDPFKQSIIRIYLQQLPISWDRGPMQGKTVNEYVEISKNVQDDFIRTSEPFLSNTITESRSTKDLRKNTRAADQILTRPFNVWSPARVKAAYGSGIEVPYPKRGGFGLHPGFEALVDKFLAFLSRMSTHQAVIGTRFMPVTQQRAVFASLGVAGTTPGESLFQYGFACTVAFAEETGAENFYAMGLNQNNWYTAVGEAASAAGIGWGGADPARDLRYLYWVQLPTGSEIRQAYQKDFDGITKETGISDCLAAYRRTCLAIGRPCNDPAGFLIDPLK